MTAGLDEALSVGRDMNPAAAVKFLSIRRVTDRAITCFHSRMPCPQCNPSDPSPSCRHAYRKGWRHYRPGWSREFDNPIVLPDGEKLRTLRDAATYVTGLPKKEAALPEWQAAIEAPILVADHGGPVKFAGPA